MKKRSLEPPKLPWSKNKVLSNPHLPNQASLNSEFPGSRSLLSLDSKTAAVPPEMTTSSFSDSPKTTNSKEETAAALAISKWRAKLVTKQTAQTPKNSKMTAGTNGPAVNAKVIAITTTSARTSLSSTSTTSTKSSVIFLAGKQARTPVKAKESPSPRSSIKTGQTSADGHLVTNFPTFETQTSGIPITSSSSKATNLHLTVKRKVPNVIPGQRGVSSTNASVPIKLEKDVRMATSNSVLNKSNSWTTLSKISSNLNDSIKSKHKQLDCNQVSGNINKKSPIITHKPVPTGFSGVKIIENKDDVSQHSKRFCEKRPRSGKMTKGLSLQKPLILYLNESSNNGVSASRGDKKKILSSLKEDDNDEMMTANEKFAAALKEKLESEVLLMSNDVDEDSFQSAVQSLKVTEDAMTVHNENIEIAQKPSENSNSVASSQNIDSVQIKESHFNISNDLLEHGVVEEVPHLKEPHDETTPSAADSAQPPPAEKNIHILVTSESTCSPSFPLCPSPSPSFTSSSENSYSENDDDDCDENERNFLLRKSAKIYDFLFDEETNETSVDSREILSAEKRSVSDGGLMKGSVFGCGGPNDPSRLLEILKNYRLQSENEELELKRGLIRNSETTKDHESSQNAANENLLQHRYRSPPAYESHHNMCHSADSINTLLLHRYHPSVNRQQRSTTFDSFDSPVKNSTNHHLHVREDDFHQCRLEANRSNFMAAEDVKNFVEWLKLENEELEGRCSQLSRENSSLTELMRLLRHDLEVADTKNRMKNVEADMELDRLRSEKERLMNELQLPESERINFMSLEKEIADLKSRLDETESRRNEALREARDLRQELEETKLEADEIRDRFSREDNRELRRLRDDLDCCVRECRTLHFKSRQAERKCDLYKARVADLEASLAALAPPASDSLGSSRASCRFQSLRCFDDLSGSFHGDELNSLHKRFNSETFSLVNTSSESSAGLSKNGLNEADNIARESLETIEQLKKELKEAREVSIRLHEECERLERDCQRYKTSSEKQTDIERTSFLDIRTSKGERTVNKNENFKTTDDDDDPAKVESNTSVELSKTRDRLAEVETENGRLMEALVYLRRKLELSSPIEPSRSTCDDLFQDFQHSSIVSSPVTSTKTPPQLFPASNTESVLLVNSLAGDPGKVQICESQGQPDSPATPEETPLNSTTPAHSLAFAQSQAEHPLSPALDYGGSNDVISGKPHFVQPTKARNDDDQLMSSVMSRHKQEMNTLLQTLRRKERQFSEERKVLRRKNQDLSEMFDMLAERVALQNRNRAATNQECQTDDCWWEIEEKLNKVEEELNDRIKSEHFLRDCCEELTEQLDRKITEYEHKLLAVQENLNRKCKTIERKEQLVSRMTSSIAELEKNVGEKSREIEERDRKLNSIEEKLNESDRERQKMIEDDEVRRAKIAELEQRIVCLNQTIDGLNSCLSDALKRLQDQQVPAHHAHPQQQEVINHVTTDGDGTIFDSYEKADVRSISGGAKNAKSADVRCHGDDNTNEEVGGSVTVASQLPVVTMRTHDKEKPSNLVRRSRSLSEIDQILTSYVADFNCIYSLVPLKLLQSDDSSANASMDSSYITTADLQTQSENSTYKKLSCQARQTNFSPGYTGSSNSATSTIDSKWSSANRPKTLLGLKTFESGYPTWTPNMTLTSGMTSTTNTLESFENTPLQAADAISLERYYNSSYDQNHISKLQTDNIHRRLIDLQNQQHEQERSSSSLTEGAQRRLFKKHVLPDHSLTLPRSAKFRENNINEENALERLARTFDKKAPSNFSITNSINPDLFQGMSHLSASDDTKYRSTSLSPRTARRRFLFSKEEDEDKIKILLSVINNHSLTENEMPHTLDNASNFSSETSTVQPIRPRSQSAKDENCTGKLKETGKNLIELIPCSTSQPSLATSTAPLLTASAKCDLTKARPCRSLVVTPTNSPRSITSSKFFSRLTDPFKRLKKSSSNKASPQTTKKSATIHRSQSPPAWFFMGVKSKHRSGQNTDNESGSLPSLVHLSCRSSPRTPKNKISAVDLIKSHRGPNFL